jgi:hypothetical protein
MSHDPLVVTLICSPASTCPPEWSEADEPDPTDTEIWDALYSKAGDLVSYAATFGLSILMLQPLNQFDGWHEGSKRGEWVKRKAEKWLPLCSKLGVEQLQVSHVTSGGTELIGGRFQ